jgi:hypothetical protein
MLSSRNKLLIITAIIVFGVIARLLPHFPNFAPMGALALFAVAFYKRKYLALVIPGLAWWLSDLYLNNMIYNSADGFTLFTADQFFSLFALTLIVILGKLLFKKVNAPNVMIGSLSASLIFFVVSNLGVWMQGILYPKTLQGLVECYSMALPFYRGTLVSDLIFTGVFFGAMHMMTSFENKNKAITQTTLHTKRI